MKKLLLFSILAFSFFSLTACGARIPSAKAAHSLTRSYFKSYGKRYKESIFGQSKVQQVEVHRVSEQSLHVAEIEAFLQLEDGQLARILITARSTPPFGWNVASWEMIDLR